MVKIEKTRWNDGIEADRPTGVVSIWKTQELGILCEVGGKYWSWSFNEAKKHFCHSDGPLF